MGNKGAVAASAEVSELATKNAIPTTTTLHAMGVFDEHHPLSLHMLGMHGAAYANFCIQNADLILAVGSRFDDRTTGNVAQCVLRFVHFFLTRAFWRIFCVYFRRTAALLMPVCIADFGF